MSDLLYETSIVDVIAFSLLHTTWISTIMILIAAILVRSNPLRSSLWKSNVIIVTMIGIIMTFLALIVYFSQGSLMYEPITQNLILKTNEIVGQVNTSMQETLVTWLTDQKQLLIGIWMVGSVFFVLKYFFSFVLLSYVRSLAVVEYDVTFTQLIAKITSQLNYAGNEIKLGYSGLISSPMVSGYFRPMILFPIGLINQLSISEVESVLAHEVAHLVRKDYIANFLIVVLEVLFYFHPGVWWLNNQLKKYREEDCDDRAISILSGNITYIKTLVKLQELALAKPNSLSLALNGSNESNFYQRIKRIMNMDMKSKSVKNQFAALGLIMLLGLFYTQNSLIANGSEEFKEVMDEETTLLSSETEEIIVDQDLATIQNTDVVLSDTLPGRVKSTTKIIKKTDTKEVEIEMEDGEITTMKVDGKEIPKEEYDEHQIHLNGKGKIGSGFYFGENGAFERFDFPEIEHEIEDGIAIMLDGTRHNLEGIGFRMDSLLSSMQSDSMMAMHFGGAFPNISIIRDFDFEGFPEGMNIERFDFEGFPEGFDFPQNFNIEGFRFPQDFNFDELENDIQRIEIETEDLRNNRNGFGWDRSDKNLEDIIGSQLNKDGFLIPNKENTILLTGKYLKINGEKQPSNIWNKYKSLFESETGVPLHKKSRLEFSIIGKQSNKRYKAF